MPTYDYKCNACSHTFEHMQSMKDKPLKKCPKCGKPALERLIGTGAAVIFKGGGFYQTDYRSEAYKKSAEAENKPADPKPESKADAKSDAKPESKPADAKGTDSSTPAPSKSEPAKIAATAPVKSPKRDQRKSSGSKGNA